MDISNQIQKEVNLDIKSTCTKNDPPVTGISNGVKLFDQEDVKKCGIIYLQGIVDQEGLKFDLIVLNLSDSKKASRVRKITAVFEGEVMNYSVKEGQIKMVQISMKQSPKYRNVMAVKISVTRKNKNGDYKQDSLSILTVEWASLLECESINLQKIKTQKNQISDFKWHPYSNLTLQVLLANQVFEVWNIYESDFYHPTQNLKLWNLKKSFVIPNEILFTSFAHPVTDDIHEYGVELPCSIINKYSLYLMTSTGYICSIFPYLPSGCSITEEEEEITKNNEELEHASVLLSFLKKCEKSEEGEQNKMAVRSSQLYSEDQSILAVWEDSNKYLSIHAQLKYREEVRESHLLIVPVELNKLTTSSLFFTFNYHIRSEISKISISLGPESMRGKSVPHCQNDLFLLREIKTDLKGPCMILDVPQALKKNLLYFVQNNSIFQLDFSAAVKFVKTNSITVLENVDAFPLKLVLRVGKNENIKSLIFDSNNSKIFIVRSHENQILFETHFYNLIGFFTQLSQLTKYSQSLIQKINKISQNDLSSQEKEKDPSISLAQKTKGMSECYEDHYQRVRDLIEEKMNKLKTLTEKVREKNAYFEKEREKKKILEKQLRKFEENTQTINNLLFDENLGSIKRQKQDEVENEYSQYSQKAERLFKIFEKVTKSKIEMSKQQREMMLQRAEEILERLSEMKKMLEEARQWTREMGRSKK